MPEKSKVETYHDAFVPLMSFVHNGRTFDKDHVFTQAELLEVTPENIMRYVKIKVYDNENARPDIDPPLNYRANTIKFWKKAWSYFMVNKNMQWNEISRVGNPTKCVPLNELIKYMIGMETARLGRPSQARRALKRQEWEQVMEIVEQIDNKEIALWLSCFLAVQFSMIARVDDTAKWRSPDLKTFEDREDYGVCIRLPWSKNVREDRDAPLQVLFGAMDARHCTLSHMAAWLEFHFEKNPEENEFLLGVEGSAGAKEIKRSASHQLKVILNGELFEAMEDGLTGTHSNRKFSVNIARGNGCSKDDTDHRGRWKSDKRQQDTYADTTIPHVDAKVAAALCKGGPVVYLVKEESGVTDQWILDYVVPNLLQRQELEAKHRIPRQVCVVLGRALLWKIFSEGAQYLPQSIVSRVRTAYNDIGDRCTLEAGDNPVRKAPIGVTGADAELVVEELLNLAPEGGDPPANSNQDPRVRRSLEGQETRILSSQVVHLRREFADFRAEGARRDQQVMYRLTQINRNVQRVAAAPGRRRVVGEDESNADASGTGRPVRLGATLSNRPKSLHDLWAEYSTGLCGRKAAQHFTPNERGRVKSVYNFRNNFWKKCKELILAGEMTPQLAVDRFYAAYGQNTSVTNILRRCRRDRINNTWPQVLQVLNP